MISHSRHRTIALVRLLHSLTPSKGRRRRLPQQAQPDGVRVSYYRALQRLVVVPMVAAVRSVMPTVLHLLASFTGETRGDADDEGTALEMMQRALARAGTAVNARELHAVAEQFGKQTTDFQKVQLDQQVRAAVGVPLSAIEKPTTDRIPGFVIENVGLIKTVPERYFAGVREVVRTAFAEGWSTDRLTAAVAERGQVADSNARRIARDQVGKLNAQVNQDRQEALGVTGYIWRGMMDGRERDEHQDREGQHFDWDDPPEDGHPGEPVQCFPGNTKIRLHQSRIEKAYRRIYTGPLVMLTTSTGEVLRATPNHPVLTRRGWIAAHLVEVGEHVFEAPSKGNQLSIDDPQGGDTLFEKVFRATRSLGVSERMRGFAGGFHGDITDENVDVIDMQRHLCFELNSACGQSFAQDVLSRADNSRLPLCGAYLLLLGSNDCSISLLRGAGKLLTLIGSHETVPHEHGIGATSWLRAVANELGMDGRAADAEAFCEGLDANPLVVESNNFLARVVFGIVSRAVGASCLKSPSAELLGQVVALPVIESEGTGCLGDSETLLQQPLRVVEKSIGEFHGYVYNLQTSSGWYVTQNLIVHNCRCYAEPDLDSITSAVESDDGTPEEEEDDRETEVSEEEDDE